MSQAAGEAWRAGLLPEAVIGTIYLDADTPVPGVVISMTGGYLLALVPGWDRMAENLGEGLALVAELPAAPLEDEAGCCDMAVVRAPAAAFAEEEWLDEWPVADFGGALPNLGVVIEQLPASVHRALMPPTPRPRPPARRPLLAAGRGAGGGPEPALAIVGGRGRGAPKRPTVASLAEQMSALAESVQSLRATVEHQSGQASGPAAPLEPDLLAAGPGGPRSGGLEAAGGLAGLSAAAGLRGLAADLPPDPRAPMLSPPAPLLEPSTPPGLKPPGREEELGPMRVPLGQAPPAGADQAVAEALHTQTAALMALLQKRKGRAGIDGDDYDIEEDGRYLPGARGPAALENLRREFDEHPTRFSNAVAERLKQAAMVVPGAAIDPAPSARAYVQNEIPFSTYRTLGYMGWGLASVWDLMHAGRLDKAFGLLSLLLVSVEQAALDEGRWSLAWLLTLLPDPPFQSMGRRPYENLHRPFARLSDPRWVAASMAYVRDVDRLLSLRRNLTGKGGVSATNAGVEDEGVAAMGALGPGSGGVRKGSPKAKAGPSGGGKGAPSGGGSGAKGADP